MWAIQAQTGDRRMGVEKSHLGSRRIISVTLLYSRRRFSHFFTLALATSPQLGAEGLQGWVIRTRLMISRGHGFLTA